MKRALNTLEMKDVNFSFDSREPLIEGLTLSFEKGKSYQISGQSGSGKTTLLKILLGLYDVDNANIMVDGEKGVHPSIGYVPSDPGVFNITLLENIAMGDKTVTVEKCETVARELGALNWINTLPDRFGHTIAENGKNLSGGQKQLIALMRTLVKEFPVIVMDEPFSALDATRESDLLEIIGKLKREKILIYTSHREFTSLAADVVIKLDE